MTMLHVVPDERGSWRLFEDARSAPLSRHDSTTEAERRAWSRIVAHDGQEIVVHDRYGRTIPAVDYDVEEVETIVGLAYGCPTPSTRHADLGEQSRHLRERRPSRSTAARQAAPLHHPGGHRGGGGVLDRPVRADHDPLTGPRDARSRRSHRALRGAWQTVPGALVAVIAAVQHH